MKGKQFHVMGDGELDRIFTEAYHKTLKSVERREKEKSLRDHKEAMTELFEAELRSRDITPEEKREFVAAFRREMEGAEKELKLRREETRRLRRMGTGIFLLVLGVSGIIYIGRQKPFTPISRIESQLMEVFEKVESGFGGYSDDFYDVLDKYEHRLGSGRTEKYETMMYSELKTQFEELLGKVEDGEITYYDDARKWAGYFPDKEERKARRAMVDNAMSKWIGRTVDESMDKVIKGAKELIEQVKENIPDSE